MPKQVGGLGFHNLEDFNKTLLGKIAWKIINNPIALWIRVLKSVYFENTDFLKSKYR